MKFSFNPLEWVSKGIIAQLDKYAPDTSTQAQPSSTTKPDDPPPPQGSLVPATPTQPAPTGDSAKNAEIVPSDEASRRMAESEQQRTDAITIQIMTEAASKTEQFRREAESFDDEKASLGEKGIKFLFSTFAYLVPSLLGVLIGLSVGDAFTPTSASPFYSWYAHVLSIALEMSLPIMGFVVALTFRRAAKDRSQVAVCAISALIFLGLGIGNAVVQVFMVTQNIGALDASNKAAVLFRAFSPLIIDTICSIYLAVTGAKSLKRYLADKRAVIEAVRDVSGINILLEQQQHTAALNQIQAAMDMQSKQKRAATWNKLEAIQADKMVREAEKAMRTEDGGSSGTGYRRRGY